MEQNHPFSLHRLLLGLALGALVYLGFALLSDPWRLVENLRQVPALTLLAALGLSLVNYALRFAKWQAYLRLLSIAIPWRRSLLIFLAGLTMSISPGKLGEVMKSLLLKRSDDVDIARSFPVVFAERFTDVLGLLLLVSLGVFVFQIGIHFFLLAMICAFALILFTGSPRVLHHLLRFLGTFSLGRKLRPSLERAFGSARVLLRPRPLGWTTLVSAAAWSMEALAFALILSSLGASFPLLFEAFFVFSSSLLLGALSFLPGGLGITEGSLATQILYFELLDDLDLALAATYLIRFTTLWFGVMVGLLAFFLFDRFLPANRQASLVDPHQR